MYACSFLTEVPAAIAKHHHHVLITWTNQNAPTPPAAIGLSLSPLLARESKMKAGSGLSAEIPVFVRRCILLKFVGFRAADFECVYFHSF